MKPEKQKKYTERTPKRRRRSNIVYLVSLLFTFEVIGMGLLILPRSTESITEKRELAKFPELTPESYFSGDFTAGVAEWFSDTVPFRDELTGISTALRELKGFRQDGIRLHNVGTVQNNTPEQSQPEKPTTTTPVQNDSKPVEPVETAEAENTVDTDSPAVTERPVITTADPD